MRHGCRARYAHPVWPWRAQGRGAARFARVGPEPKIRDIYQQRWDVLVTGLDRAGWPVEKPRASMFVWAPIPERFRSAGSLEFSKLLMQKALVAVSPGIGFGPLGEGHVRFSLVENEHRIRQAARSIKEFLAAG